MWFGSFFMCGCARVSFFFAVLQDDDDVNVVDDDDYDSLGFTPIDTIK